MTFFYLIITLNVAWLVVVTFLLLRISAHYQRLIKGVAEGDLTQIWQQHLEKASNTEKEIRELARLLKKLSADGQRHLQKVGVVRFNPFNELGGNQSFVVSLLDENGDGMVLSSLHGRDSTRVYAKPVKNFKESGFELSTEEKDAIHNSSNA